MSAINLTLVSWEKIRPVKDVEFHATTSVDPVISYSIFILRQRVDIPDIKISFTTKFQQPCISVYRRYRAFVSCSLGSLENPIWVRLTIYYFNFLQYHSHIYVLQVFIQCLLSIFINTGDGLFYQIHSQSSWGSLSMYSYSYRVIRKISLTVYLSNHGELNSLTY